MSLITDKIFYEALAASTTISEAVDGRIYNTAIATPEDELNEPLPYIIITFDGMQNEGFTKDNSYEGDTDNVQIGIIVAASDRETLGTLMTDVRAQIVSYFENYEPATGAEDLTELIPRSYTLSASPIQYDFLNPCYYQTLTYQCSTNP